MSLRLNHFAAVLESANCAATVDVIGVISANRSRHTHPATLAFGTGGSTKARCVTSLDVLHQFRLSFAFTHDVTLRLRIFSAIVLAVSAHA